MTTSSNGNIFGVFYPLWWETTGYRWFPPQRPVTRSFCVLLDLRLIKRLSNNRWFDTPSCSSWRNYNDFPERGKSGDGSGGGDHGSFPKSDWRTSRDLWPQQHPRLHRSLLTRTRRVVEPWNDGFRYNTRGAWITCPVKRGMKLLIHSETSTLQLLTFGNR